MFQNEFFVTRRRKCQDCDGTGTIQEPLWAEYWKANPGGLSSPEADIKWFNERAGVCEWFDTFADLPPEEIACPECEGDKVIEQEVTLASALAYLGLELPKPPPDVL